MKQFLSIIFPIVFFGCSTLNFDSKPPFTVTSALYKNWIGGQPGVKGTNVKITYVAIKPIEFDSIYFRGKVTKLQIKNSNSSTAIFGYFNTSKIYNDIILSENSIEEFNNPIPEIKKFPFQLKQNEAVISYKKNKNTNYYKIILKKE